MKDEEPGIGTFTTDTRLVVRTWDEWLARATGMSAAEAVGRPLSELVPDLEGRGLRARFERVLADGVVEILAPALHGYLFACPPRTPSHHFAQMQQRVTIAPLAEGSRIVGTLVTVEDVTARRERERDFAEQLRSPDDTARLQAAQALAAAGDTAPELAGALGDVNWRVRKAAVAGIAEHGETALIASIVHALQAEHRDLGALNSMLQILGLTRADATGLLVALLRSDDADLRSYVALALGERGDRAAVPALLALLDDPDANVRYHAVEALGKLRAGQAAQHLAAIAAGGDGFLAFAALDALARIGEELDQAALLPLLDDPFLAEPAADLLGRVGDLAAVGALARALADERLPAATAARALAALFDREALRYGEGAPVADEARRAVSPAGAARLSAALASARDEEVHAVAQVLAWLGDPAAIPALIAQLGRPGLAEVVVEAVVRGAGGVDELIALLTSPDDAIAEAAAAALGRLGVRRAAPALAAQLEREGDAAIVAAGALAQIGDPGPFEALLAMLRRPEAAARQAAVGALNAIGHPQLPARIAALLDDPDPHVREAAVQIAGYFGYPACAPGLLARRHDPDERVRRAAVAQLPFVDEPEALPALAEALRTGNAGVRAAAARAFAHVEAAQAVPALLAALADPDAWTRYYAARSLGQLRAAEAVPLLIEHVRQDTAPQVRLAAATALGQIGATEAAPALAPLAAAVDPELARAALSALGQIADPAARPPLVAALAARDSARRLVALEALARRGDPQDIPLLRQVAEDDRDPAAQAAAVVAIGAVRHCAAAEALVELAADPALRPAAVAALAAAGAEWADAAAAGLTHPDPAVRRAMVEALARMRHPAATAHIRAALHDPDPTVHTAAIATLERMT